jgi:hypothetical protein
MNDDACVPIGTIYAIGTVDMTVVKKGWVPETRVSSQSSSSQVGGTSSSQRSSFGATFWAKRRES